MVGKDDAQHVGKEEKEDEEEHRERKNTKGGKQWMQTEKRRHGEDE